MKVFELEVVVDSVELEDGEINVFDEFSFEAVLPEKFTPDLGSVKNLTADMRVLGESCRMRYFSRFNQPTNFS
jgi:hypothetical protein